MISVFISIAAEKTDFVTSLVQYITITGGFYRVPNSGDSVSDGGNVCLWQRLTDVVGMKLIKSYSLTYSAQSNKLTPFYDCQ